MRYTGAAGTSIQVVRGTARGDVWAIEQQGVGTEAPTRILRWNGTTFAPAPGAPANAVRVAGTGPTDVWAFSIPPGQTVLVPGAFTALSHFDGVSWTSLPSLPMDVVDAWAVPGTATYAVSSRGMIAVRPR